MRKLIVMSVLPVLLVASGCRSGQVMWGACTTGNDPWGTDGKYVLVCRNGEWQPVMTVQEYVAIQQGKKVTIAPLPTKPTTTTTTTTTTAPATTAAPTTAAPTTTSTTTTAAPTTTSTTIPVVAPEIMGSTAPAGPIAGGQVVTVLGNGFTGTTSVTFGGTAATFSIVDDDHLEVTTPAHAAGPVTISVTNPAGTASESGLYRFVAPPVIDSISPSSGPAAGGTTVTITGSGLEDAGVNFGAVAGTDVVASATSITVTSPAGTGTVDVRVFTYGGLTEPAPTAEFTYL